MQKSKPRDVHLYQKTSFGSVARIENSMSVKFQDNWTFPHGALPIFLFHTKLCNFRSVNIFFIGVCLIIWTIVAPGVFFLLGHLEKIRK